MHFFTPIKKTLSCFPKNDQRGFPFLKRFVALLPFFSLLSIEISAVKTMEIPENPIKRRVTDPELPQNVSGRSSENMCQASSAPLSSSTIPDYSRFEYEDEEESERKDTFPTEYYFRGNAAESYVSLSDKIEKRIERHFFKGKFPSMYEQLNDHFRSFSNVYSAQTLAFFKKMISCITPLCLQEALILRGPHKCLFDPLLEFSQEVEDVIVCQKNSMQWVKFLKGYIKKSHERKRSPYNYTFDQDLQYTALNAILLDLCHYPHYLHGKLPLLQDKSPEWHKAVSSTFSNVRDVFINYLLLIKLFKEERAHMINLLDEFWESRIKFQTKQAHLEYIKIQEELAGLEKTRNPSVSHSSSTSPSPSQTPQRMRRRKSSSPITVCRSRRIFQGKNLHKTSEQG